MMEPHLHRIRLRAQRRVLYLRWLWAETFGENTQGFAIPHTEVDRILRRTRQQAREEERRFYADDAEAQALADAIAQADRAACGEPMLAHLADVFELTAPERHLLSVTAALEVMPELRRVYGYLHDDLNACFASPQIAADVFGWDEIPLFRSEGALIRWQLARPVPNHVPNSQAMAAWMADPAIVRWLTHSANDWSAWQELQSVGVLLSVQEAAVAQPCLYPKEQDAVQAFCQVFPDTPVEIELVGAEGSGRQTLAAQIAVRSGIPVWQLNPNAPEPERAAVEAVRAAKLTGGAICFADSLDKSLPLERPTLSFRLSLSRTASRPPLGTARKTLVLPALGQPARRELWNCVGQSPPPVQVMEGQWLPAEIAAAGAASAAGTLAAQDILRPVLSGEGGSLFTLLDCPFTWDDIVLPPALVAHLQEIEAEARLRDAVYEEWEFGHLRPFGRGVTALFAGPSGTGKTMAAQVLARSLNVPLCRVDLAGMASKYIGESEKNMRTLFETCQRNGLALFFDEADAFFGKRTEIRDAHDRYANIAIDDLLLRMEQFEGLAILATNRKSDLDTAFLRRLRFLVDFPLPGQEERERLWRKVLPAPTLERDWIGDIAYTRLAARLELTGAEIKSIAIGAAFLAKANHHAIGMEDLLHAVRRERAKQGRELRASEWNDETE